MVLSRWQLFSAAQITNDDDELFLLDPSTIGQSIVNTNNRRVKKRQQDTWAHNLLYSPEYDMLK